VTAVVSAFRRTRFEAQCRSENRRREIARVGGCRPGRTGRLGPPLRAVAKRPRRGCAVGPASAGGLRATAGIGWAHGGSERHTTNQRRRRWGAAAGPFWCCRVSRRSESARADQSDPAGGRRASGAQIWSTGACDDERPANAADAPARRAGGPAPSAPAGRLSGATRDSAKTARSGSRRRRRGFASSDRVTRLPNRCFTGVRITPARRRIVRTAAQGRFSASRSGRQETTDRVHPPTRGRHRYRSVS
jgi:hypothetical protein